MKQCSYKQPLNNDNILSFAQNNEQVLQVFTQHSQGLIFYTRGSHEIEMFRNHKTP